MTEKLTFKKHLAEQEAKREQQEYDTMRLNDEAWKECVKADKEGIYIPMDQIRASLGIKR